MARVYKGKKTNQDKKKVIHDTCKGNRDGVAVVLEYNALVDRYDIKVADALVFSSANYEACLNKAKETGVVWNS